MIDNVKLGICSVNFNGVDLGLTKGGVVAVYTPEYHDTVVDLYGSSVIESTLIGEALKATVPLAESTHANLMKALPAGTEVIDGGDPAKKKITIGSEAGKKASANAAILILHPIENEVADKNEDVTMHKAFIKNEITLSFLIDGEKVIEVEFNALIDSSKSAGDLLGSFGDDSAT